MAKKNGQFVNDTISSPMPTAAAMIMSPLAVAASNIDEPLVGSASVSEVGAVVSEGGGSEDPQPLQCKFL